MRHSTNTVFRFQAVLSKTEKAQSVIDAQINTVIRCIVDAVDTLQVHGYDREVNSLQTMDGELRAVMNSVDKHIQNIISDFEAHMRQLTEIKKRMGELSTTAVVITAQKKCRDISKESLDSQLDKSEDLLMLLDSAQKEFNDTLHIKLTGLHNTLIKLEKQQAELSKVETEVIPELIQKVEKIGRRVNKTALAAIVGGGGSRMENYENPEVTNLKETLLETQREKAEFSEKVSNKILFLPKCTLHVIF